MIITLTNDFHNTSVNLRANMGDTLSASQVRRARNSLCGNSDCTCSGDLGTRGPGSVSPDSIALEMVGADRDGRPMYRVIER